MHHAVGMSVILSSLKISRSVVSRLPVDSNGIDEVASFGVSNDLKNPYEGTTRKKVLT